MKHILILLTGGAILLALPLTRALGHPLPAHPPGDYLFGVINNDGLHYDDQWDRGVRATTLELHWNLYEPQEGVFDPTYVHHMQETLATLKSQGWHVQLIPGYQYVPEWVFDNYPDMRYVNQYGQAYDPPRGSFRVINAPFNPQARTLISRYISRIFRDFNPDDFDSVRVGGGVQGELRYPPPEWNGHSNNFWAFDRFAQDSSVSGIPAEVVGWRPGINPNPGSEGRDQLIVNPGFEKSHPYLDVLGWAPDDEVEAIREENDPGEGNASLRLDLDTPHRVHQYVPVRPETTYRFGASLRSADGQGQARVYFTQINGEHDSIDGAALGRLQASSAGWVTESGELTTAPDARFLKVELDGDAPGSYFFDELWLQPADAANDLDREITVPVSFYDWYVERLTAYQQWQIEIMRQYYDGQLDLIYPGKGVLPDQVTDALTNDLAGDGWSESSRGLYSGTAYDRHVAGLATTENVVLYLTGVEDPPAHLVNDRSHYPGDWSAARWLAHLAQGRGLAIWGENSGQDSLEDMQVSAQRMHDNRFIGLMWAFESELYGDEYADIDEYESIITLYNDPRRAFLPLLREQ